MLNIITINSIFWIICSSEYYSLQAEVPASVDNVLRLRLRLVILKGFFLCDLETFIWIKIYNLRWILKSIEIWPFLSILFVYTHLISWKNSWLYYLDFKETSGEELYRGLFKDAGCCFEQILEAAPYKTAATQLLTSHLAKLFKKDKQDMLGTVEEVRMNS